VRDDFRPGDVRHSLADVSAIRSTLGYAPDLDFGAGIDAALDWYLDQARAGG
jgi:UDP-N-acetylglucosamine 4-epimerase